MNSSSVNFDATSDFNIDLAGIAASKQYDRLKVMGTVTLGNATLHLTQSSMAKTNDQFIIIDNDGGEPINGTFANLPENAIITLSSNQVFKISYTGGDGNDVITGGRGNDTAQLGSGDDTFVWNPGDGSDVVDGQDGTDTLVFNGSNVSENISIAADHGHAKLTRDVGTVTMDLNSVEQIQLGARGGADNIVVGDLTGTGVTEVAIDLAGVPGSGVGDGQADTVTANATAGNDTISITNSANATVFVSGLAADVTIDGADPSLDTLVVNGLGGNDTIDASFLSANWIKRGFTPVVVILPKLELFKSSEGL